MTDEKLKELETVAAEMRYKIKKTAMDLNYNSERMTARGMHHNALAIAGMAFRLNGIEDQINRAKFARAYQELHGEDGENDGTAT